MWMVAVVAVIAVAVAGIEHGSAHRRGPTCPAWQHRGCARDAADKFLHDQPAAPRGRLGEAGSRLQGQPSHPWLETRAEPPEPATRRLFTVPRDAKVQLWFRGRDNAIAVCTACAADANAVRSFSGMPPASRTASLPTRTAARSRADANVAAAAWLLLKNFYTNQSAFHPFSPREPHPTLSRYKFRHLAWLPTPRPATDPRSPDSPAWRCPG